MTLPEHHQETQYSQRFWRSKKFWFYCGASLILIAGVTLTMMGYRIDISFTKRELQTYQHKTPAFSFLYDTSLFSLDEDTENRYDSSYLIGIKVKDDPRTGCDARLLEEQLDLSKPLEEVTKTLNQQLGSGAADFQSTQSDYTTFKNTKALVMNIQFAGPLGDAIELRQIFLPQEDDTLTLICGGNKSLKRFYEKEYERFFESFSLSD